MKEFELFEKQMLRQAAWLSDLRRQLFRKANLINRKHILDIGCGSGIITQELQEHSTGKVIGLDNDPEKINILKQKYPEITFICAEALDLPFENNSFDFIVTSWLWLWIKDISKFASQIQRVLKPGGVYISLAEMDSEAVIEYPDELTLKKDFYIDYITAKTGDPFIARKLKTLFVAEDLNVTSGAFTTMFNKQQMKEDYLFEWDHIRSLNTDFFTDSKIQELINLERISIENNTRFLFRPVFWLYVNKVNLNK